MGQNHKSCSNNANKSLVKPETWKEKMGWKIGSGRAGEGFESRKSDLPAGKARRLLPVGKKKCWVLLLGPCHTYVVGNGRVIYSILTFEEFWRLQIFTALLQQCLKITQKVSFSNSANFLVCIDLIIKEDDGWTAFMFACRYGRQDVVKLSNEIFLVNSEKVSCWMWRTLATCAWMRAKRAQIFNIYFLLLQKRHLPIFCEFMFFELLSFKWNQFGELRNSEWSSLRSLNSSEIVKIKGDKGSAWS